MKWRKHRGGDYRLSRSSCYCHQHKVRIEIISWHFLYLYCGTRYLGIWENGSMFFPHCLFELELCTNCSYTIYYTYIYFTSPGQRQCHSGRLWLVLHGRKHVSLADIYPCMYVCMYVFTHVGPFFHTRIYSKAQMPQILLHNCGGSTPRGDRYTMD